MPAGWVLLSRIQEGSGCRPFTHFKKCHPCFENQDAYKFMRSCRLLTGWWDFTFYQVGSILSKDTQENWQKYTLPKFGRIFMCVGWSSCMDGQNFHFGKLVWHCGGCECMDRTSDFHSGGSGCLDRGLKFHFGGSLNKLCQKDITGHYNKT